MPQKKTSELEGQYPNIAEWVFGGGWIEIGPDGRDTSFARALDEGGLIWEGKRRYDSLDEVLKALDQGIADRFKTTG